MSAAREWIPLDEAIALLEEIIRQQEEPSAAILSPYERRAQEFRSRERAQYIIDMDWKTGCLPLRATTFRVLEKEAEAPTEERDKDIPPEFGEWAFFDWTTGKIRLESSYQKPTGSSGRAYEEASGILVRRVELEERLDFMRAHIPAKAKVTAGAAWSVPQVIDYILSIADGARTEEELRRMADDHFGRPVPQKSVWRDALKAARERKPNLFRSRGNPNVKSGTNSGKQIRH